MDPDKALGGSTTDRHQHGLKQWHRQQTTSWPLVSAQVSDTNIALGCHMTTDPNMALKRRSSPGNEAFFISAIPSMLRARVILGLSPCRLQVAACHPTNPTGQRPAPSINPSPLSHLPQLSHLFCTYTVLLFHLLHLSIIYSLVVVTLEAVVCHTVHPFTQTCNVHCKELLV